MSSPEISEVVNDGLTKSSQKESEKEETAVSFKGRNVKFPMKLMLLLDSEEYVDIVAWNSHGRSFVIRDEKEFEYRVLHTHFNAGLYSSFIRKLYRWGFSRILRGNDGAFSNEKFLRGKYDLCKQIKARHVRSSGVTYNAKKRMEDREKIAVLPFLLDQRNTMSLQGKSKTVRNLNTVYQPIQNRITGTVPLCDILPQVEYSSRTGIPGNNLFYTGALASSVGLNTSRSINVHSRTLSPMSGHVGYKNSPNVSAEEKAMKAMELIIALGV